MEITIWAMKTVLAKLSDPLVGELTLEERKRKSIQSILKELPVMDAFICKMVRVPPEQLDEGVKIWAATVRDFSYKMVYIIDAIMVHAEDGGDSANLKNRVTNLLKKTIRLSKKGKDLHWNALEEAVGQATELIELRPRYKEVLPDTSVGARVDPREMTLYKDVRELIGIEDSRNKLVNMLIGGDDWSKQPLKTISIVGFGGVGKTTLAKVVYDKIKGQFDCGAFISVCQNPNMKKVLQNILYRLDKNKYADNNQKAQGEKELINELIEFLSGKRYLIVIDDIWGELAWGLIKCAFHRRNSLGSRIITTTRIVSLSEACCSSYDDIYQMGPLSCDDSRKLLFDRMFGSVRRCPREFEQVSSDILKKCAGVPLAIIAMASVLAGDLWMKPKDELHLLLESIGRGIGNECWENMQRILSLSYYGLPFYMKTYLLYLSTFPVTHPIERERLVKKLIAEGFIIPGHEDCNLEDLSSSYLNEFVNRNVMHPLECNNDGEVISYHIHPMMHDILKAIAMEEKFAPSLDDKNISRACHMNVPHLSIDCPDSENLINLVSSMAFDCGARSLTVFGHANRSLLSHFEGIRLLDLEGCKSIERADLEYICGMVLLKQLCLAKTQITELPPQIGNLQYLEGLDVGGTQITQLPPQIGKLHHLKTLDTRKSGVKNLPDEVVQLTRLVRLLVGDNESCEGVKLPDGFGKMRSLKQLGTIDLRKCSPSSLKEFGKLWRLEEIAVLLSNKPEDTGMNDTLLSSLSSTNLTSLVVCNDFRLITPQFTSYNLNCQKKLTVVRCLKVPLGFRGNHSLILHRLDIRVCKLEEDGLKILGEMPRLQSLIVRLEVLPTEMIRISCEGFAQLESFYVDCRMPRVIFEEGAMPNLEHLELKMYSGSASEEHMCIKHLIGLQKVTLRYAKWYATNKGVRETTEAVKTEAKEHQNEITFCIAEEEKNGICNTKTEEVFQENRVASCSRMTEIEEKEDTQEGGLNQSSHDIASCSGTSEIEEVVE